MFDAARRVDAEELEQDLVLTLASNVRRLREKRKLTLEAAAHEGGLSVRYWQKVEAGEHPSSLRTLAKLAVALEVEPIDLLR